MIALVAAGAGFLLAVLWFDLMFDVQVLGHRERELPEELLASIAGYYRRVTSTARPMNRLIAAVMAATLAGIVAELVNGDASPAVAWASLALAGGPILLAGIRTVPSAVRLGGRGEDPERQTVLARAIYRQHVLCLAGIAALLALQLSSA